MSIAVNNCLKFQWDALTNILRNSNRASRVASVQEIYAQGKD